LPQSVSDSTPRHPASGWLAAGALLASFGLSIAADFTYRYRSGAIPAAVDSFRFTDQLLATASDGHGLFLHYSGFNSPDSRLSALSMYMRANYLLYPQPVLATDPSLKVATPNELLAGNFDPDGPWMNRHNVDRELSLSLGADGKLSYQIEAAPPGR
jgi:hypothetical protein